MRVFLGLVVFLQTPKTLLTQRLRLTRPLLLEHPLILPSSRRSLAKRAKYLLTLLRQALFFPHDLRDSLSIFLRLCILLRMLRNLLLTARPHAALTESLASLLASLQSLLQASAIRTLLPLFPGSVRCKNLRFARNTQNLRAHPEGLEAHLVS